MNTYIAFLRGINVGGRNKLPMAELKKILADLKLVNVKTYIQSGNVVFQSSRTDTTDLASEITAAIDNSHGFAPQVFILTAEQLQAAIDNNPFPEGEDEPKTLHLYFMDTEPKALNSEKLDTLKADSERYQIIKDVFYLHAPDGIGRSKLAAGAEKNLGDVAVTARNWNTVSKMAVLVKEVEESA